MLKALRNPAVSFLIILFASWVIAALFSRLSFRQKKTQKGSRESYACGEDSYDPHVHPDYSSFFPFAFFFTMAHVACMILTTLPKAQAGAFILAALYIVGTITGLYILLKRR